MQVPLSQVARFERGTATLAVRHQGQYPAATISFNLKPGYRSGRRAEGGAKRPRVDLRLPDEVRTEFAGNAQFFQKSLATQPLLIGAALISIYIVLGVLYESWLHPLTIMSTLPSAGVGALLALLITGTDLSIMGDHRHHSADGHREEERHHDDRFRAGGGTSARADAAARRSGKPVWCASVRS